MTKHSQQKIEEILVYWKSAESNNILKAEWVPFRFCKATYMYIYKNIWKTIVLDDDNMYLGIKSGKAILILQSTLTITFYSGGPIKRYILWTKPGTIPIFTAAIFITMIQRIWRHTSSNKITNWNTCYRRHICYLIVKLNEVFANKYHWPNQG